MSMPVLVEPIRTEADYERALLRVQELWDAPQGSPQSVELEVLASLVSDYEEYHHKIRPPDEMRGRDALVGGILTGFMLGVTFCLLIAYIFEPIISVSCSVKIDRVDCTILYDPEKS